VHCRFIGEETAAQKGHNFDTVSICMEGDFTNIKPSFAQQETLIRFVRLLVSGELDPTWAVLNGTPISIPKENVLPHRVLQPNHTSCYGTALPDDWARVISFPALQEDVSRPLPLSSDGPELNRLRKIVEMLKEVLGLHTLLHKMRLGGMRGCGVDVRS